MDNLKTPAAGFDGHLHIRTTSDLMPRLHAAARRQGLTAAGFVRMVLLQALSAAEPRSAPKP